MKRADSAPNSSDKNYAFFSHLSCEFFPCHKTDHPEDFNCLFCYCPLYALGKSCGGNYSYAPSGAKDCSACVFPHVRENYKKVLSRFDEIAELAKEK